MASRTRATVSNLVMDYTVDADNFELECVAGAILDALSWIGVDVYALCLISSHQFSAELEQELPEQNHD